MLMIPAFFAVCKHLICLREIKALVIKRKRGLAKDGVRWLFFDRKPDAHGYPKPKN